MTFIIMIMMFSSFGASVPNRDETTQRVRGQFVAGIF